MADTGLAQLVLRPDTCRVLMEYLEIPQRAGLCLTCRAFSEAIHGEGFDFGVATMCWDLATRRERSFPASCVAMGFPHTPSGGISPHELQAIRELVFRTNFMMNVSDVSSALKLALMCEPWNWVYRGAARTRIVAADRAPGGACELGWTAMHEASAGGDRALVCSLLDAGHDPNAWEATSLTPMHLAANAGSADCVLALLRGGGLAFMLDNHGQTPLHMAAARGHYGCMLHLIAAAGDEDQQQCAGMSYEELISYSTLCSRTPVHKAAACTRPEGPLCVRLLVTSGADKCTKDKTGVSPLHVAAQHGNVSTIGELVALGCPPDATDAYGETPLHHAAWRGQAAAAARLIDAGCDPVMRSDTDMTPLHRACQKGQVKCVRVLLDHVGSDVNARCSGGGTPLSVACQSCSVECVCALLQHRLTDTRGVDERGCTVLHTAVTYATPKIVRVLLGHSAADINTPNAHGCTPLHAACQGGRVAVMEALISAGADIEAQDALGKTPLFYAQTDPMGDGCARRLLRYHHPDIEHRTKSGNTPLLNAVRGRCAGTATTLIAARADPMARTPLGATPLHVAASQNGPAEVMGLLAEAGADVMAVDVNGDAPLHTAARHASAGIVRALVRLGADVDQRNAMGQVNIEESCLLSAQTPLHVSVLVQNVEVVTALVLEFHAQTNVLDAWMCVPMSYAASAGEDEIRTVLTEAPGHHRRARSAEFTWTGEGSIN